MFKTFPYPTGCCDVCHASHLNTDGKDIIRVKYEPDRGNLADFLADFLADYHADFHADDGTMMDYSYSVALSMSDHSSDSDYEDSEGDTEDM